MKPSSADNQNHGRQHRSEHKNGHRQSSLSLLVWEGTYANVFIILTGGAFLTGLAIMLGAGDFELGLLAAAPFLLQSAQLLSPFFFHSPEREKKRIGWMLAIARFLWLLLIPLLFLEVQWRLHLLISVVVLSSLITMAASPAWLSLMAGIVPARVRGRFFSRRNAAIAAVTVIVSIVGSIILDWARSAGVEPLGFLIILVSSGLGAVMSWRAMSNLPDKHNGKPVKTETGGLSGLLAPVKDQSFRRVLLVFSAWNAAIGSSAAFFAPHMLLNLKMSFFQIGLYSSSMALVAVVSSRYWGRLIDRFGSRVILNIAAIGIGVIPLVWLYPRADLLWILIPEALYSGVLWAGFNLAAFTLPLDRSPEKDRTAYLSVFAAVTGAAFFATSLLSGYIAEHLTNWSWQVGERTMVNYHILFFGSAVLRLATAGLVMALREPSEVRLPVVVQLMGYAVLKFLSVGRQILPFAAEAGEKDDDEKI